MLKSFKINGYKTFSEEAKIDFSANKQIKNKDYVFEKENVLKSAIIYGPNNTGKSTFIEAIKLFKKIILDGKLPSYFIEFVYNYNYFTDQNIISFEIEFIEKEDNYKYILEIEFGKGIINEILYVNEEMIFDRNSNNNEEKMQNIVSLFKQYNDRIIMSTMADENKKYTDAIVKFMKNMIIINNEMNFEEMVDNVQELSESDKKFFAKIMKNADISIDDIKYENNNDEKYKSFNLISYYKMNNKTESMPSIYSDSDGTKEFMRYILSIIKLRKSGGILIVDEIDKSLHTLLTKSIISLFNSEDNNNIQLLATTHDLQLLDAKFLFRKDQIWFTYKDNKRIYFYSLNDFKTRSSSVRNDTLESYLKGMFGALPHPNIEEVFYEI